jgi:hypothetical protein
MGAAQEEHVTDVMTRLYEIGNGTDERIETRRLSDDGTRIVIVTRWLDRQVLPPKWRSKNRTRKLTPGEIRYFQERGGS